MAQQAVKTQSVYQPSLVVIKGNNEYRQQVDRLTSIAWQITYTSLWNGMEFSVAEKENAVMRISQLIEQGSPVKAYSEFVQRVLLARQYILSHPGTYAPLPSQWLSIENKNGYAGTLRWYLSVETTRAALPKYKQPLKAFSEAVLETVQSGNAKDFHYWRSYFSEQDAQQTLNLFLSTVANCSYL
jgi:hypothetical protein